MNYPAYTSKSIYEFNLLSVNSAGTEYSFTVSSPLGRMKRTMPITNPVPHYHNYFEVVYVLEGEYIQIIENEAFHYKAGQCCILNKNIIHCEQYTGSAKIFFMMLTDEFLEPLIKPSALYPDQNFNTPDFHSIKHLIKQNCKCNYYSAREYIEFTPVLPTKLTDNFEEIIHNLIHVSVKQHIGSCLITAGFVSYFFSLLETDSYFQKKIIHLTGNKEDELVDKITNIYKENHGRITRSELTQQLNYNADYMNRIVKKATGMTLTEYGNIFRLEEAAALLLHTNLSITAIMSQLDFSNKNYFTKIFTNHFHVTPGFYRKKHHTEND